MSFVIYVLCLFGTASQTNVWKTFGKEKAKTLKVIRQTITFKQSSSFVRGSLASLRPPIGAQGDISHMSLPRG